MKKKKKKYHILTLKQKIQVLDHLKKHGWGKTCAKFNVSRGTVVYWVRRMAKGSVNGKHPLERKDKRHTIRQETEELVKKIHKRKPHLSLSQIQELVSKTINKLLDLFFSH